MKATALEGQVRKPMEWDMETLGWIGMLIVAVTILALGAWEVRQQNLQLATQGAVAALAE